MIESCVEGVCLTCGEHFVTKSINHIYCDSGCRPSTYVKAKTLYQERICVMCEASYKPKTHNQKYCSKICSEQSVDNKGLRYERIFLRDGYKCAYCGKTSYADGIKLHVDHISPKSMGGEDKFGNLITSCEMCNISKGGIVLDNETMKMLLEEVENRNALSNIRSGTHIKF